MPARVSKFALTAALMGLAAALPNYGYDSQPVEPKYKAGDHYHSIPTGTADSGYYQSVPPPDYTGTPIVYTDCVTTSQPVTLTSTVSCDPYTSAGVVYTYSTATTVTYAVETAYVTRTRGCDSHGCYGIPETTGTPQCYGSDCHHGSGHYSDSDYDDHCDKTPVYVTVTKTITEYADSTGVPYHKHSSSNDFDIYDSSDDNYHGHNNHYHDETSTSGGDSKTAVDDEDCDDDSTYSTTTEKDHSDGSYAAGSSSSSGYPGYKSDKTYHKDDSYTPTTQTETYDSSKDSEPCVPGYGKTCPPTDSDTPDTSSSYGSDDSSSGKSSSYTSGQSTHKSSTY